ncbi:uncharacterized protein LOC105939689 [Fundulus heteroclitus]|uniref:uncharacterized protein LOC105939689 n=1 Tax=Fundulus heteroclitus TaxID=8078 RepID=UPI00165A389B|nr:uncharacterized protein LOC105939689 [Fundulus heteroclitus]
MAVSCDDPQPQNGKCLPSQESGDAGFSADMKHNFSDDLTNKFSSVRPMLKEASEIAACQVMRKELLHHLAFECAGEEVTNLGMSKQSSPNPEEQSFQRRMASDVVESFASCCPKGKARKIMQKKHRRVSERGRTANRQSRKQWKFFHLLCCCILALGLVDVCEASAGNPESTSGLKIDEASTEGSTCFTCMDKDRCPNLTTIYAKEDVLVYVRSTAEKLPKCSGALPITKNCSVCWSQSDVIIHCPKNISKFDVEDSNGSTISNIVKGCKQQKNSYPAPNGSANKGSHAQSPSGLLCSLVAFLMVPSLSSWGSSLYIQGSI